MTRRLKDGGGQCTAGRAAMYGGGGGGGVTAAFARLCLSLLFFSGNYLIGWGSLEGLGLPTTSNSVLFWWNLAGVVVV